MPMQECQLFFLSFFPIQKTYCHLVVVVVVVVFHCWRFESLIQTEKGL